MASEDAKELGKAIYWSSTNPEGLKRYIGKCEQLPSYAAEVGGDKNYTKDIYEGYISAAGDAGDIGTAEIVKKYLTELL